MAASIYPKGISFETRWSQWTSDRADLFDDNDPSNLHHIRLATDAYCYANACALTIPTILRYRDSDHRSEHDFTLTDNAPHCKHEIQNSNLVRSTVWAVYFLLRCSRTSRPAYFRKHIALWCLDFPPRRESG